MKVYYRSGGIAPCTLKLSRWRLNGQLHSLAALSQGKNPQYPLNRRLGGPQSLSGCSGEDRNSQPLPGT